MPNTLTLSQARQSLWKYASPVDYSGASSDEKAKVDSVINQVVERFLTQGKWRGSIVRAEFAVFGNTITLPDALETAIKIAPLDVNGNVCGTWQPYNQWYSILGPTDPNAPGYCKPFDLGEGFATIQDPSNTFYVKAVCDLTESGKTILLRGIDQDNRPIYTAPSTEGVSLALSGTTQTTQMFNGLSYWVKSAATNGVVRLYAVDVTTAVSTLIAVIPPARTVSNYRRYAVPWDAAAVRVIAKRGYVPAVSDNDPIIPSNLGALKKGMQAIREEDVKDERAPKTWAEALDLLDQERGEYDGDHLQTLQVASGYGCGDIPVIR